MIRKMKEEDLQQCGVIYAKAFPIEYWGIDWNPDNAKEYLLDYYEQKRLTRKQNICYNLQLLIKNEDFEVLLETHILAG